MAKLKTGIAGKDPDHLLERLAARHADSRIDTRDGVKIDLEDGWVHMRKSNTEPIIRVYAEARSTEEAVAMGERFMRELSEGA
jgi:phosphomannomutase